MLKLLKLRTVIVYRQILLFPEGNDEGKGDHLSIYVMLESTSTIFADKYVNASFKFFLFDQIRGKYLTVEGIVFH